MAYQPVIAGLNNKDLLIPQEVFERRKRTDFVARCLTLLSESQREGDEWVVAAYLAYSTGNIFDAGTFADRALTSDGLDPDKEGLATYIRTTTAFAWGSIDRDQLESGLRALASAHPASLSALYVRLDEARRSALTGHQDRLDEVRALVAEIEARGEGFEPVKCHANIVLLEARYFVLNSRYIDEVVRFKMTEELGVDAIFTRERAQRAQKFVSEFRSIFDGFEKLYRRALKMKATHPALIGEVIAGLAPLPVPLHGKSAIGHASPPAEARAKRLMGDYASHRCSITVTVEEKGLARRGVPAGARVPTRRAR